MKKGLFVFAMIFLPFNSFGQNSKGNLTAIEGIKKFDSGDDLGAVTTFTKAIEELNPKTDSISLMLSYSYRGQAKSNLGDNRGAILDLTKSISFTNERTIDSFLDDGKDFLAKNYSLRGNLKELLDYPFQEVIGDFNVAIRINPSKGIYYAGRGNAKIQNGQKQAGCLDLSKAGELGFSQAYEYIKELCN